MPQVTITIPPLHPAQKKIKDERKRFNVLACGRRFGKNVLMQDLAIETTLAERKPCAWIAPQYRLLQEDWRVMIDSLFPVITRRNEQLKQIELQGGGVVKFYSLENAQSIRGEKFRRVIVNEAGLAKDLAHEWEQVIRPTLIDYIGDAYFGGTPKGRNGFYALYMKNGAEWAKWQNTSYANPHINKGELDALKETMSERSWRQEIEAEFVEDGAGVFRRVRECATASPQAQAIRGHDYVIGVDWGRTNDATVFAVIDVVSRECVYIDRMTQTDYALQMARLVALNDKFKPQVILAELNSMGSPMVERAQQNNLPMQGFNTTNSSKTVIIDALALAFERGDVRIIKDETLIAELQAYESERLPSGLVRYSAPSGMHDDSVIALALAWSALDAGGSAAVLV